MEEDKQIELRSEKVRNIIGQVPPVLLRYGISIIGLSLLMLVGIGAFIPYQPDFEIEVTVEQDSSGELVYKAFIPQKDLEKKSDFDYVTINSGTNLPLPGRLYIGVISDVAHISSDGIYYTATLYQKETASQEIIFKEVISIPAKIKLYKKSVLTWVLSSF